MISIHTLRGEGDVPDGIHNGKGAVFQSTPSVGRATEVLAYEYKLKPYFNPHPPWGGRRCLVHRVGDIDRNFNPHPPWGGRRYVTSADRAVLVISIHTLRGEGDPDRRTVLICFLKFQSTPSVGRATTAESSSGRDS